MTRPIFMPLKLHGMVLDLAPEDVAPDRWTNGRNVFFKAGEMYRCEGINQVFATPIAAQFVWYVDMGPQEWWIYGGDAGVGVTDGLGNFYTITPTGWGAIASKNFQYTVGDINMVPFVNHPERGPYYWDGNPAHIMLKLPDWPAGWSCQSMRAHKNFLLAIGIDTGAGLAEGQVSWSSSADPGQVPQKWVPAPTNDAGDITFAVPGGPLIDGISVRDQFFVMKTNATFSMSYVGGQYIFAGRDVFPSTGILAIDAAIEHGNMVYMLTGHGEFIRHDGTTLQNLLYGVAQDYFNRTLNYEWPSSVFMYFTDQEDVVACAYPTGTSKVCTEAIGVEIDSIGRDGPPDIGIRDLPGVTGCAMGYTVLAPSAWDPDSAAWNSDTTLWNEQQSGYRPAKVVFAGGSQGLLELGRGVTMMGANIVAFAERQSLDMQKFGEHKVISGAIPKISGNAGDMLYMRFGSQEYPRGPVEWGPMQNITIDQTRQLDFFEEGRLISVAMGSIVGGNPWKWSGLQLMARPAGRW